jgi:hypothetical protein
MRYRLKWLAAAFVAAVLGLLFQLFYKCEHIHGWKNKASPQCPLPKQVAIVQLVSAYTLPSVLRLRFCLLSVPTADILADLSLILLPIRLIRGIKDKRLMWRLIFIFSTSSEYLLPPKPTKPKRKTFFSVVTTIVSLVHAAYIISRGGIPVIISALVEDCMSLTVANLPVVATASFRHLKSSDPAPNRSGDGDGDGQRWSTWKFKTRTLPVSTAFFTSAVSHSGAAGPGDADAGGTSTELASTAMDQSKGSVSVGMGAYSLGSVAPDDLFANGTKSVDGTPVRREDKGGVVRIDVLPYDHEHPPPPPKP